MKRKVLITGANGFIGSSLVEEGLNQGYEVYAGIRKGCKWDHLRREGVRIFRLDLSSREQIEKKLRVSEAFEGRFDYIIHAAGATHARRKQELQVINDQYTRNLVESLRASGNLPERFVFISSLAAGGPGDPESGREIRVSDPERPISAYGRSKLSAESYIKSLQDFPFLILRLTAVYGPRDLGFLPYFKFIQKGIQPRLGFQPQRLSFVYVKDLASLVFRVLDRRMAQSTYLVSDGKVYEKDQFGNALKDLFHRQTLKITIPLPVLTFIFYLMERSFALMGNRPRMNLEKLKEISSANWSCNSQAIWDEIRVCPAYSLESGLKETADWYRKRGWLRISRSR